MPWCEAEPRGPEQLGSSLQGLLGGRAGRVGDTLVLVVLHVDDGLPDAVLRLRREGFRVSVVHVAPAQAVATETPFRRDAPARLLVAAGARYFPVDPGADLRTALAPSPRTRRAEVS